jgi:hypothetical protein
MVWREDDEQFPALFTPMGSSETFPAQLHLRSTVSGALPESCPALNGAHVFVVTNDYNLVHSFTGASDFQDQLYHPNKRLEMTEFDVLDRPVSLGSSNGQPIQDFAIRRGETGTNGNTWKLSLTGEKWDPTGRRYLGDTEYRGSLFLSVPGYDPESGTVRSEDAAARTPALADAEQPIGPVRRRQRITPVIDRLASIVTQ